MEGDKQDDVLGLYYLIMCIKYIKHYKKMCKH